MRGGSGCSATEQIRLIADNYQHDPPENQDPRDDVRAVDALLMPHQRQHGGRHGLDVAVERRVHRGELLGSAVEQVHGQHGSENQDIEQFGLPVQGQMEEIRAGDIDVYKRQLRPHPGLPSGKGMDLL